MKKGIDISYHQSAIDFDKVKKEVDFVIVREGYRNTVDPMFLHYTQGFRALGVPVLAVYHFSYALNEQQAAEEAKLCVSNMKEVGLGDDILVFYDFEYDTVKKAAALGVTLTKSECNAFTIAFCEMVRQLGYNPGVYTNTDYYKNWYSKDVLDRYPIWLADYKGEPDYPCLIHQYSSTGKVSGIVGNVDMNFYYDDGFKMNEEKEHSRTAVADLVTSWIGRKESDGSHKHIIDIYNSYKGQLPRGIKMQYDWAWCACTWSSLAIALGYTDIMPIEISCGELVNKAKEMGCWQESDFYVPNVADAILYDWDDNGVGDNTGWPDHVGTVVYSNSDSGYMVVVEGNCDDSVKKRTISINGRYIRGFITPKYGTLLAVGIEPSKNADVATVAREVITGLWGNYPDRKTRLEAAGYNYEEIRAKVNEILNGPATGTDSVSHTPTVAETKYVEATCYARSFDASYAGSYMVNANPSLYCRNDAGTNKKALCKIPNGTRVSCFGYYTPANGVPWLLIQVKLGDTVYTGFSSSKYLKKV